MYPKGQSLNRSHHTCFPHINPFSALLPRLFFCSLSFFSNSQLCSALSSVRFLTVFVISDRVSSYIVMFLLLSSFISLIFRSFAFLPHQFVFYLLLWCFDRLHPFSLALSLSLPVPLSPTLQCLHPFPEMEFLNGILIVVSMHKLESSQTRVSAFFTLSFCMHF
jgi:hypothetical protein